MQSILLESRREKRRSQPVSRILFPSTRGALRRATLSDNDHSSRPVIAHWLRRPTRWLRTGRPTNACASGRRLATPAAPPYLVLLRAGFCLPPTLPPARCALTAPFHPYPSTRRLRALRVEGGIFSVPLIRQVALPGRYPAHCPSEFGLSSPPGTTRRTAVTGSSDRLADCDSSIISYCLRSPVSCLRSSVSRYIWSIDLDAAVPVPWGDDRPASTNSK